MLDCSIVIVTYNGWALLRQCLASLESEIRPGIGVTIVDNGSADGLPDRVRTDFSWVDVVETGANLGFAAGNNLGMRRSASKFVMFLNSDVIVRPGFVESMLGPFDTALRLGSVAAAMVFRTHPDIVASAGIDIFSNGLALDRSLGQPLDSLVDRDPIFGASAGAAVYRREALDDVGLFHEPFFMYLEDVDLAWRLRLRGWESALSASAVVEHAYSASSGEGSRLKRRLLARNRIWGIVRCFPGWLLAGDLWRIAGYDLMVVASATARRDGASVTGRVEAVAGLKTRLRERREIQGRATASRSDIKRWIGVAPPASRLLQLRELTRAYAVSSSSCGPAIP